MHKLIKREITATVKTRLKNYPAVALLGARQVGKSTLAGMIIEQIIQINILFNCFSSLISELAVKKIIKLFINMALFPSRA